LEDFPYFPDISGGGFSELIVHSFYEKRILIRLKVAN
jgi:hypothetical protein